LNNVHQLGHSSQAVETHVACPCGQSSDAFAKYSDGHGFCFSCSKTFDNKLAEIDPIDELAGPYRGISSETLGFYGVFRHVRPDGNTEVNYPFPHGTQVRVEELKQFYSRGSMGVGQLFGADKFPPSSAKAITIHEGANDALSGYEMFGRQYPNVSVRSASSAVADCKAHFDYLNSFETIYLAFDNDEPGQTAAGKVAQLFDFNKIRHVKYGAEFKDANDVLRANQSELYRRIWFNARKYTPDSIVSAWTDFDKIIDADQPARGLDYPFPEITKMTYGMRPGEVILIKAMEGIGKTELVRAIEHNVLKKAEEGINVGLIHLEEDKARSVKGLVGLEIRQPVHLPDSPVSREEIKRVFRTLTKRDDRLHIYDHFGSDDPRAIVDVLQFLAGPCGCKYIFLDHISMIVSGTTNEDERKTLDWISTRVAMLAKQHNVCIVMVSHVNDDGLTRGSRNISKVAHCVISLRRDIKHPDPAVRCKTEFMIEKNRFGSMTGPAGAAVFNNETFTLDPYTGENAQEGF
jgi:DnaB helicase-like protein/Toprim domain-containing protein